MVTGICGWVCLVLLILFECGICGAILFPLCLLLKLLFQPISEEAKVHAYFWGVFVSFVAAMIVMLTLMLIVAEVLNFVWPDDDNDTRTKETEDKKFKGRTRAHKSVVSEPPSDVDQTCNSRTGESRFKRFILSIAVCLCSRGKKFWKSPRVEVAVISPSEVTGAKWQSGREEAVICQLGSEEAKSPRVAAAAFRALETAESRPPRNEIAIVYETEDARLSRRNDIAVCPVEVMEARLSRGKENVECPPPSYNDVIGSKGYFWISKEANV